MTSLQQKHYHRNNRDVLVCSTLIDIHLRHGNNDPKKSRYYSLHDFLLPIWLILLNCLIQHLFYSICGICAGAGAHKSHNTVSSIVLIDIFRLTAARCSHFIYTLWLICNSTKQQSNSLAYQYTMWKNLFRANQTCAKKRSEPRKSKCFNWIIKSKFSIRIICICFTTIHLTWNWTWIHPRCSINILE